MKNPVTKRKKGENPSDTTTISLDLAKIRVSRWLEAVSRMPGFKGKEHSIPRAIFIDFKDIKELVKDYPEVELKGIRIYFGLAGEDQPIAPSITDLRGMVVPVLFPDGGANSSHTLDLITSGNVDDPDDTSIYDFTTPCPIFCDTTSELYVPFPS